MKIQFLVSNYQPAKQESNATFQMSGGIPKVSRGIFSYFHRIGFTELFICLLK